MLYYHHIRPLEHVHHGIVPAVRLSQILPEPACLENGGCQTLDDPWHDAALLYEPAYEWLARQSGFWPLFLAVGVSEEDLYMTGYQNQFRRVASRGPEGTEYITPGQQCNDVLFSFARLPDPKVFSDYDWWHLALNGGQLLDGKHERPWIHLDDYARRRVLKPSWRASDWLRKARREPHTVQVAVPQLDLRFAPRIWCRNQATRQQLLAKGFAAMQVEVQRLKVPRW